MPAGIPAFLSALGQGPTLTGGLGVSSYYLAGQGYGPTKNVVSPVAMTPFMFPQQIGPQAEAAARQFGINIPQPWQVQQSPFFSNQAMAQHPFLKNLSGGLANLVSTPIAAPVQGFGAGLQQAAAGIAGGRQLPMTYEAQQQLAPMEAAINTAQLAGAKRQMDIEHLLENFYKTRNVPYQQLEDFNKWAINANNTAKVAVAKQHEEAQEAVQKLKNQDDMTKLMTKNPMVAGAYAFERMINPKFDTEPVAQKRKDLVTALGLMSHIHKMSLGSPSAEAGVNERAKAADLANLKAIMVNPHSTKQERDAATKKFNQLEKLTVTPAPAATPTQAAPEPGLLGRMENYLFSAGPAAPGVAATQTSKPPAGTLPAAAVKQLKPGVHTRFANGQVWTLENGKPVRVQ